MIVLVHEHFLFLVVYAKKGAVDRDFETDIQDFWASGWTSATRRVAVGISRAACVSRPFERRTRRRAAAAVPDQPRARSSPRAPAAAMAAPCVVGDRVEVNKPGNANHGMQGWVRFGPEVRPVALPLPPGTRTGVPSYLAAGLARAAGVGASPACSP